MGKQENKIEQYLIDEVEKMGGIAYKFTSPGRRGVPDRLCVFPNGIHAFIETKTTEGEVSPGQYREIEKLRAMGHKVFVTESKKGIDTVLCVLKNDIDFFESLVRISC